MSDQIAKTVTKQDSTSGRRVTAKQVLMFDAGDDNTWQIEADAGTHDPSDATPTGPFIRIRKVDSDGVADGEAGVILLDLESLAALELTAPVLAKFRELRWKDASTCVEYKAGFLMTEPEAV